MERGGGTAMKRAFRLAISAAILLLAAAASATPVAAQGYGTAVAAYERGDYPTALRLFRTLADQGNASAQYDLGSMYENGEGVEQDYAEAAKWYRRAAKQGHKLAQLHLGYHYEFGWGVLQDYAEAVKWWRLAAEQGLGAAQFNLGFKHENGVGVPQNLERAYIWFNIAASPFPVSDETHAHLAVQHRDRIAAILPASILARAQRIVREWKLGAYAVLDLPTSPMGGDKDMRSLVARVQNGLALLGYDPGPTDGIMGPRTRAAILALQQTTGLTLEDALRVAIEMADAEREASSGYGRVPVEPDTISTGSGFRVSAEGHILTNAHVIEGCLEVQVPPAGPVAVAARDDAADLALLKGPAGKPFAAFRQGRGVRPGAGVVALGYPLRGVLASGANVTTGNVAALAGPGDDRRLIQITAPVQRGNSGGPVLDMAGNAVGVVVSKLDAVKMARATGDIPQNVNFAVSAGAARAFLDSEGVAYTTAPSKDMRAPEDVAAAAKAFTVLIECRGEG